MNTRGGPKGKKFVPKQHRRYTTYVIRTYIAVIVSTSLKRISLEKEIMRKGVDGSAQNKK